jgi:hypothetical protein
MRKRMILVFFVLALLGGGYRLRPDLARIPPLSPTATPFIDKQVQQRLLLLLQEPEVQRAWAAGRHGALRVPASREAVLQQSLLEQRALLADEGTLPAQLDLEMSLLEETARTAPHDRRFALLLVKLIEQAAADPELRPMLAEALQKALTQPDQP